MRKLPAFILLLALLSVLATGCRSKRPAVEATSSEVEMVGSEARKVLREAEKWLGTPYRYGAKERGRGTDCSGMVMTVYEKAADIRLPRNSAEQQRFCKTIDKRDLQPGDLVFFSSKRGGSRVSHVGIYRGKGEFIHASSSRGVIVSRLDEPYYQSHYHSAGRVLKISAAKSKPVREIQHMPAVAMPDTLTILPVTSVRVDTVRPVPVMPLDTAACDSAEQFIIDEIRNAFKVF